MRGDLSVSAWLVSINKSAGSRKKMETVSGVKGEVSCVRRHPPRWVALACGASSRQAVSAMGRSSLTLGTMAMAGFGHKRSSSGYIIKGNPLAVKSKAR